MVNDENAEVVHHDQLQGADTEEEEVRGVIGCVVQGGVLCKGVGCAVTYGRVCVVQEGCVHGISVLLKGFVCCCRN